MENSYYINGASECKYLEEFDHLYVYRGSCRFSIYRFKKEKQKKYVVVANKELDCFQLKRR
jgi:hypothetical protein